MTERGDGVNPNESPLDMASTLEWYRQNKEELLSLLPEPGTSMPSVPLKNLEHFYVSPFEMQSLIELFPDSARSRSYLDSIEGNVRFYFHKDSTPENILPTVNVVDAISPTAFVPGYTETRRNRATGEFYGIIKIYEIPTDDDIDLKKIVQTQAFVHEFAHTIIHPIKFSDSYYLKLPDGEVVEGGLLLDRFKSLMDQSTPFSFYSKSGRDAAINNEKEKITAVDEELSEAISAYLLGFIFSENVDRRMDPFMDRPVIREFVRNFLLAERVMPEAVEHDEMIDVLGGDEGEDESPLILNTKNGAYSYSHEEVKALGGGNYKKGAMRISMAVSIRSATQEAKIYKRPLQEELEKIFSPGPAYLN